MIRIFKLIAIGTLAVFADATLAHQPAQSAMNQNGSSKVIAQMRCMWKQSCTEPITVPPDQHTVRAKGKLEH